jgi:hypothetical protein
MSKRFAVLLWLAFTPSVAACRSGASAVHDTQTDASKETRSGINR